MEDNYQDAFAAGRPPGKNPGSAFKPAPIPIDKALSPFRAYVRGVAEIPKTARGPRVDRRLTRLLGAAVDLPASLPADRASSGRLFLP